jgi:hypothetical protein
MCVCVCPNRRRGGGCCARNFAVARIAVKRGGGCGGGGGVHSKQKQSTRWMLSATARRPQEHKGETDESATGERAGHKHVLRHVGALGS